MVSTLARLVVDHVCSSILIIICHHHRLSSSLSSSSATIIICHHHYHHHLPPSSSVIIIIIIICHHHHLSSSLSSLSSVIIMSRSETNSAAEWGPSFRIRYLPYCWSSGYSKTLLIKGTVVVVNVWLKKVVWLFHTADYDFSWLCLW